MKGGRKLSLKMMWKSWNKWLTTTKLLSLLFLLLLVTLFATLLLPDHWNVLIRQPSHITSYPIPWSSVAESFHDHSLTPNNLFCSDTQMLILVGSHPQHGPLRQVLRKSWQGQISGWHVQVLFVFGQLYGEWQRLLELEHQVHGDILQGQFTDSYHNVTIRDLMGFRWVVDSCPGVRFVGRADDDIVVDIHSLVRTLQAGPPEGPEFVGCFNIVRDANVQRWDRYAISKEDYPGHYYDDYCEGWLYVVSPSTIRQWLEVAPDTTLFWINDVCITGTLRRAANQSLSTIPLRFTYSFEEMLTQSKDGPLKGDQYYELGPTHALAELARSLQAQYATMTKEKYTLT